MSDNYSYILGTLDDERVPVLGLNETSIEGAGTYINEIRFSQPIASFNGMPTRGVFKIWDVYSWV